MANTLPILLIGTTSPDKVREYRQLFSHLPARLLTPPDLGIDLDVEEGETSFEENAELKARAFHAASGVLTLAEDSGFEVDALGGEPGVISARWGGTRDYAVKNRLILERLDGLPRERRACRYVSYVAILTPDGHLHRHNGSCEGYVAFEPAGDGGFGYDPIFFVPELGRTMAQLAPEEKDAISHRGCAARRAAPRQESQQPTAPYQ
jgi:XTP/dITP diphosphohydrolase